MSDPCPRPVYHQCCTDTVVYIDRITELEAVVDALRAERTALLILIRAMQENPVGYQTIDSHLLTMDEDGQANEADVVRRALEGDADE